jgi:hypothetical protein
VAEPLDADVDAWVMPGVPKYHFWPRVFSLLLLGAVGYGLFEGARAGYYLATDAQIAPILLSPESDAVMASKLSLAGLEGDRDATQVRIEVAQLALDAGHDATRKLSELRDRSAAGLAFSGALVSQDEAAVDLDSAHLREQRELLSSAIGNQQSYLGDLQRQLSAGVVHRLDVTREERELQRLRLLALENEREQLTATTRRASITLTQRALVGTRRSLAPDALRHQEQLIRIELELNALQTDRRSKLAELQMATVHAARLDQLIDEIKARPIYRAALREQLLAFVPYTQLARVASNAHVYACRIWSAFDCRPVGRIAEVLPGEIAAQDPWGAPARGQYAVLELDDSDFAKAKVLRVRTHDAFTTTASAER